MDSQVTRAETRGGLVADWRAFGRFLRRPVLPDRASGLNSASFRRALGLFALDLAIIVPLVLLALTAEALGFEFPDSAFDDMEFDTATILLIVFAIPLVEEVIFRGWLSGRPGHLLAYAVLVAAAILLVIGSSAGGLIKGLIVGAAAVFAAYWLWKKWHAPALDWFQRHFVWFFAVSSLLFAFIHVFNYDSEVNLVYLLPLVIPQFLVGLILGYARITLGFWANCLIHFAHNGLLIAVTLALEM